MIVRLIVTDFTTETEELNTTLYYNFKMSKRSIIGINYTEQKGQTASFEVHKGSHTFFDDLLEEISGKTFEMKDYTIFKYSFSFLDETDTPCYTGFVESGNNGIEYDEDTDIIKINLKDAISILANTSAKIKTEIEGDYNSRTILQQLIEQSFYNKNGIPAGFPVSIDSVYVEDNSFDFTDEPVYNNDNSNDFGTWDIQQSLEEFVGNDQYNSYFNDNAPIHKNAIFIKIIDISETSYNIYVAKAGLNINVSTLTSTGDVVIAVSYVLRMQKIIVKNYFEVIDVDERLFNITNNYDTGENAGGYLESEIFINKSDGEDIKNKIQSIWSSTTDPNFDFDFPNWFIQNDGDYTPPVTDSALSGDIEGILTYTNVNRSINVSFTSTIIFDYVNFVDGEKTYKKCIKALLQINNLALKNIPTSTGSAISIINKTRLDIPTTFDKTINNYDQFFKSINFILGSNFDLDVFENTSTLETILNRYLNQLIFNLPSSNTIEIDYEDWRNLDVGNDLSVKGKYNKVLSLEYDPEQTYIRIETIGEW